MSNFIQRESAMSQKQISYKEAEANRMEKVIQILPVIFLSGMTYLVIVLNFLSMFKIHDVSSIAVILGILVIGLVHSFAGNMKRFIQISLVIFIVFLGVFIFQNQYVMNGFFIILNQINETIGIRMGYPLKQYTITISPDIFKLSTNLFASLFFITTAFICSVAVQSRHAVSLWLVIIPFFVFQAFTGIIPSIFYTISLFICGLLLVSYSFLNRDSRGQQKGKGSQTIILSISAAILVLCCLIFFILMRIEPISGYTKNHTLAQFNEYLNDKLTDFRYEKTKTNTFTQGDFRKLSKLELNDIPALEVVMEKPTSLYLRGYVGSVYTSNHWTDLPASVYYHSSGLFYWLNKSQFHALNQLSAVSQIEDTKVNTEESGKITVNNLNANSKYLYNPYELESDQAHFEQVRALDDSQLRSTAFFGNRLYNYQSRTNLVTKYPALASQLYAKKDMKEASAYFQNESHYNDFVYKQYTKLPKDTKRLLQNYIELVPKTNGNHVPYEEAIKTVQSFLQENIKYKANAAPMPEGKDFLRYFLEESREGYATHYATAATVMFRYLGIPSRYVEGYLITPKDVKDASGFEPIKIKGTNAHAWTEIYLDEIGWIPIEVTPPYYGTMGKTDLSNYPGDGNLDSESMTDASGTSGELNNNKSSDSSGKQMAIDDKQHPDSAENHKTVEKLFLGKPMLIVVIVALLLLAAVICLIKKRRELRKLKKGFEDPDYKAAIPRIFAYTISLLHYNGLAIDGGSIFKLASEIEKRSTKEYVEKFKKVITVNQVALFSHHGISQEHYDEVKSFMNETLSNLVKSKNILQRIKMKFWDFLY